MRSLHDDGMLGPRSLGEALRMVRQRARLSRDELARLAGVSAGTVSNYENDISAPAAKNLRRLCRTLAGLLECDPAELWEQVGIVLDRVSDERRFGDSDEQFHAVRVDDSTVRVDDVSTRTASG